MIEPLEPEVLFPPERPRAPESQGVGEGMIAGIILTFSLVYLVYLTALSPVGLTMSDYSLEGISLNSAQRLATGETIYQDFHAPGGPGGYYALAFVLELSHAMKLPAQELETGRVFWAVLGAITAFMAYKLGRALMPPMFAVLVAILFVAVHPDPAEIFVCFFVVLITLLVRQTRSRPGSESHMIIGLVIGVAFLFRDLAGLAALAGAVTTLLLRASWAAPPIAHTGTRSRLRVMNVLLLLVCTAIPIGFVWLRLGLPDLREWVRGFGLIGPPGPAEGRSTVIALVGWLPLVISVCILLPILRRNRRGLRYPGDLDAAGLAVANLVLFLALPDRAGAASLRVILLPTWLLCGRMIGDAGQQVQTLLSRRATGGGTVARVIGGSALILALLAGMQTFMLEELYGSEESPLMLLSGRAGHTVHYQGRAIRVATADAVRCRPVESFFQLQPLPQDESSSEIPAEAQVFCIPFGSFWYRYLDRPNPTYYEATFLMTREEESELIRQIADVDYLIYDTRAFRPEGEESFARRYPLLDRYIFEHFQIQVNASGQIPLDASALLILKRQVPHPAGGYKPIEEETDDPDHRPGRRSL